MMEEKLSTKISNEIRMDIIHGKYQPRELLSESDMAKKYHVSKAPVKRTDPILTGYIKSAIGVSAVFITSGSILTLENIGGIASFVTPVDCAASELYKKTFMFVFFIYAIIFNSLNT